MTTTATHQASLQTITLGDLTDEAYVCQDVTISRQDRVALDDGTEFTASSVVRTEDGVWAVGMTKGHGRRCAVYFPKAA